MGVQKRNKREKIIAKNIEDIFFIDHVVELFYDNKPCSYEHDSHNIILSNGKVESVTFEETYYYPPEQDDLYITFEDGTSLILSYKEIKGSLDVV